MSRAIRAHVRSNVVGYVAIFMFAIGGTAYATHPGGDNTIDSGDIINGQVLQPDIAAEAVGTDQIKNNQVRSPDIKNGEVSTDDVLDETLGQADLGTSSVASAEIANETITTNDLQSNSVQFDEIEDATVGKPDMARRGRRVGGRRRGRPARTGRP